MVLGTTEQRNEKTTNIDLMDSLEIVKVINEEDHKIADAIEKALPEIAKAVDLITEKIRLGGRYLRKAGGAGRGRVYSYL